MKGYFIVYANTNEPYDIKCEQNPESGLSTVPREQKELYSEVESATSVIKSLINTKDEVKMRYFNKLLTLAQVGLVGESAQPELALIALEKLKEEIVMVEGQRIKNSYMKRLGITAAIITAILMAVYFVINHFSVLTFLSQYLVAWAGAMAGTWISFGARKFVFKFTHLSVIEEDMMSPAIRLIYIGLCSAIFLLLLSSRIVNLNIGEVSTADIAENIPMQAIVGIICGLVESKIGITIYKKAKSAITEEKA